MSLGRGCRNLSISREELISATSYNLKHFLNTYWLNVTLYFKQTHVSRSYDISLLSCVLFGKSYSLVFWLFHPWSCPPSTFHKTQDTPPPLSWLPAPCRPPPRPSHSGAQRWFIASFPTFMAHHRHHQAIQEPFCFILFAPFAPVPIPFRGYHCNAFNISLDVCVSLKNICLPEWLIIYTSMGV